MGALIGLLAQVESFKEMLGDPTRLSRIQKALGAILPEIDVFRSHLSGLGVQEAKGLNDHAMVLPSGLGAFAGGAIDGMPVGGLDGTGNYASKVKMCGCCHSRSRRGGNGEPEMLHRAAIASTIGPGLGMCVIIDSGRLAPLGPSSKAEGGATAALKTIPRIPALLGKPLDYLAMGALYLKTPVLDAARKAGTHAKVRL